MNNFDNEYYDPYDFSNEANSTSEQKVDQNLTQLSVEDGMPQCVEKCLVKLLFKIRQNGSNQDFSLKEDFNSLINCLSGEYNDFDVTAEVRGCVESIRSSIDRNNLKQAEKDLQKLLKILRPFDLEDLFSLMEKTKQAEAKIRDKEVVLLLGRTGSGKSTTLHCLAGSKFKKIESKDHYEPYDFVNDLLEEVKSSTSANSETRYILPIEVDLKTLINKKGNIFLCDTPGFNDTAGNEVDIANMYGIVEAIKKCKNVRLVVFISFKSLGDRYEGIIEMAELLHQMIPKIEDHLKSVAYVYTKFPSVDSITHALNEALNKDDLNETISEIIESMLEENPILIDPLNPESAKTALKRIVKLTRIEYPNEIFKNITNSKAYDCLIEQVNLHERAIDSALARQNYDLITFKLTQLSKLKSYLKIDFASDRLFAKLDKYFNELYKTCWSKITNWFNESMNILSQDQVDEIKDSVRKFQMAKSLISTHLKSKFDYVTDLYKEIVHQCEQLFIEFEKCPCETKDLQLVIHCLENIKTICSEFTHKCLDELFKKTRKEVGKKFDAKTNSIQKFLHEKMFDFEQLAEILTECKRLKTLYLKKFETKDELDIENKFKSACSLIKEYFEVQKEVIIKNLEEGGQDEKESIKSLVELIENLNKSMDCGQLCTLIEKEDLKEIMKSINKFVLDKISAVFMVLESILSQSEVNKTLMDTIESNYNEIKKWREIGDASNSTSDSFHKLKAKIIDYLVDLNKTLLEDSFDDFRNNNDIVNFESMKLYFQIMKNAQWLDELKENFYFELYKKFENDLLKRAKDLSRSYAQFNISVENYKNIKDANQIYLNMMRFGPLSGTNDEISRLVQNVENNFKQKMEEALSVIKKEIIEENLTKEKLKCSFLDCAIKFIDEATSNSISVINLNELEVLKHSIKDFLISYHNAVSAEFEENFRLIKDSEFDVNLEKIITEKSEKMVSRLKEFIIMKSSHSSIYGLVNSYEDLIDKWKGSLVAYASELGEAMNFSKLNQQDRELNTKIIIAKVMSYFDSYFDGRTNRLFYDLYIKYQTESIEETICLRKTIIDLLNRKDFSTVRIELSRLDDMKISDKNLNDIRNSINLAIENLVEDVESCERRITKDLSQEAVEDFVKGLKILRKVQKEILNFPVDEQAGISNYIKVIDKQVSKDLDANLEAIHDRLFTKLRSYLQSIEKFIEMDDFYEVEDRHDKFDQVRTVLSDHFSDFDEIQKIFDSIEEKLEKIVESLVDRYDKMPLDDYRNNYPKDFFDKLEKIKSKKQKYRDAFKKIEDQIIRNMRQYMNSNQEKTLEERLDYVEGLLWYLPENINHRLSSEIARKKKEFSDHKSRLEKDLMRSLEVDDLDKIFVLKKSLTPDTQDLSDYLDCKLSEHLQNKIYEMKKDLRNESVEQAVKNLVKINKYAGKLSDEKNAQELFSCGIEEEFFKKFESVKSVVKMVKKADDDDLDKMSQNIEDFFICSRIFIDNSFTDVFKDDSKREMVVNEMKELMAFFTNNRLDFDDGLDQGHIEQVIKSLKNSLKCDLVAKIAKNKLQKSNFEFNLTNCTTNCLIKSLNEKVDSIVHDVLNTNFMDLEKVKYEKDRIDLYKNIYSKLKFLKELNKSSDLKDIIEKLNFKNFSKLEENEQKIAEFLNKCVSEICENILKIMESPKFSESELKDLRLNYENLVTLDNVFEDGLPSSSRLKEIQTRLLNKCKFISQEVNPSPANTETTVTSLINLKLISDNLTSLKSEVDTLMEESLKKFQKKHGGLEMLNLASTLEDEETGLLILRDYQIFKGEMIRNRAEKTAKHDIHYVLENLRGDAVSKDQLEKRYTDFDTEYHALVKRNISSISNAKTLDKLINETKKILNTNNKRKIFGTDIKNKIPKLVAHIFALWTLKNTKYYNEMKEVPNKDAYLLKPHPAQVIAIFRLLGGGYDAGYLKMAYEMLCDSDLQNNLVQVGTGEGKSVILAVVAIVLALAGFDVSCACYSEYLSERDYNDFKEIFQALNVEKYVFYGTFNQVCENFLNQNHDIRESVINLIKSNTLSTAKSDRKNTRPKILLIDEVDVFFNQDFLGNLYVPSARLRDPSITKLINLIWSEKKSINFQSLKKTSEYKEVKEKFSKWISLIDEALKDVLADLKSYESHEYKVFDDRIAYKEQDSVQTNIVYGYKTLFAYYHENERGKISSKSLNENISLGIYCGCFSYCEIPKKFQYILGVTGTLETLSSTQKSIISEMYKIKFSTYIPSIYGERKLVFRNEADTLVATKVDYFLRLKDEIDKRILGTVNVDVKRAVLVFFDKIETLNSFYASPQMEAYRVNDDVNILKEDVTLNDKIYLIKKATTSGKITLLTRSFGRGIDFICTSRSMLNNGGVHVIQTFFSDDPSEEIQIMGRTARQGETGSYSLILMDEDLEKFFGTSYKVNLETMRSNALVYHGLNEQRNLYFNKQTESILKAIEDVKVDHEISEEFLNKLFNENVNFVKNFLIEKNRGAVLESRRSKTIFLMDATGSMGHLLDQVKNTICVMFERAINVLKEYSLPADSFEIQLVVYRDYDSREKVLQVSGWEIKPLNLRNFMSTVSARGGGDYEEAIEVGLWHVNQEQSKLEHPDRISQVILIGDAPAKSVKQIKEYRSIYGGEAFWKKTKFKTPTYYRTELETIKASSIPVHTFYVMKGPEKCFAEIASLTGGQTGFLDVNSSNGADRLIDLITPLILNDVGTLNGGMGSRLVEEYKKKYPKSYA